MYEGGLMITGRRRAAALGCGALFLSSALAGCGGTTGNPGGGGSPSPGGDAATGYDDASATQSGRSVPACSACESTELCVANTLVAGICSSPSPSGTCPPGTTFESDCCVPNPTITYACWPIPPSCAQGLSCDCASGIVILTCGQDLQDNCTLFDGGVGCTTPSA
jgi:hypothetical protein